MMVWANAASTAIPFLVIVAAPEAFVTISPAVSPRLTTTPPLTPTAPGWICDAVIVVLGGRPVRLTVKSAVAAVICPPATVVLNTIVAVPRAPDSALVIGGTSFAADIAAVNVGFVAVGAVGLSLPHPATSRLTATARAGDQRFIGLLLETLTGQVDAEIIRDFGSPPR